MNKVKKLGFGLMRMPLLNPDDDASVDLEQVKEMVHRVIRGKMEDGQLVSCDLTLSELSRVEESFLQTFTGILHDRITYPKEET